MKYGVLCALLALTLGASAVTLGGFYLAWLWPALSLYVTAIAYGQNAPALLGKRPDGSLAWWSWALLGPWIVFSLCVAWFLRRLSREPASAAIGELYFGRRPTSKELPSGEVAIVDLTSELPRATIAQRSAVYVNIPLLDARGTEPHRLLARLHALPDLPTYVHCAQGHGRTGMVVAALLLARGIASTPDDALSLIHAVRPRVRLSKEQHTTLDELARIVTGAAQEAQTRRGPDAHACQT